MSMIDSGEKTTLYEAILESERTHLRTTYQEVAKINKLAAIVFAEDEDNVVESGLIINKVLLDEAYRLKGADASGDDLDRIESELGSLMSGNSEIPPPAVMAATRDHAQARIIYFQQLIQQEGRASTAQDAVRQQFGSEEAYRAAFQPVLDADMKFSEAIEAIMPPAVAYLNQLTDAASRTLMEKEIKEIFQTESSE